MREKILVGVLSAIFFLAIVGAGNVFASDAKDWFEKGLAAAREGNYQKAVSLFKKACNAGAALGCRNLGLLYNTGLGVNQSYTKAASSFKKACNAGAAGGCNNLGVSYYKGQGVPLNKIKAYQYWMKAAKEGNAEAQHNLDVLCRESPWACR